MTLYVALDWVRRLIAIAVVLQTLELMEVQNLATRLWPWRILKRGYTQPWRGMLGFFLEDKNFPILLLSRVAAAVYLLFWPSLVSLFILLLSSYLINVRWRGTFNGGSDVMTFLILFSLTIAYLFHHSRLAASACLWYVAVQSTLSYFVAGWVKLAQPTWRSGEALNEFLALHRVSLRPGAPAAWALMLFEAVFPMALLSADFTVPLLLLAMTFHLLNALLLGLNRFVWAWLASYPAILYAASLSA